MKQEMLLIRQIPNPAFSPGRLFCSPGVVELVLQGRLSPSAYLHRHLTGDWGDVTDNDRRHNDAALASRNEQLLSAYQVDDDLRLWIITKADRSVTELLLPSEY